jgi:metal-responsive CopG/Arc/MetJ family transcriptional regulator
LMKTIQMTLDEGLVEAVDQAVKDLKTTRSAFTRHALQSALDRIKITGLEEKHRKGYAAHPVTREEFKDWEEEQDWGSK